MATPAKRKWAPAEDALLLQSGRRGADWRAVAALFPGASPVMCAKRWSQLNYQADGKDFGRFIGDRAASRAFRDDATLLADRDARNQARFARTDITAILLGDPLPGRSALDRLHLPASTARDRRAEQLPTKPTLYWGKSEAAHA